MCGLPSSRGRPTMMNENISCWRLGRDWAAACSPVGSGRARSRRCLTRSPSKTELLSYLGAEPILCDVFDREALIQAVRDFKPDVVLNELTDLPDDAAQIEAARLSGSPKLLAQSVAWQLPDGSDARAVTELERSVLAEGGVVLR